MLNEKSYHCGAQRLLVQYDFDELAAHGRRADHPHHVIVVGQERIEGVDDRLIPGHITRIDVVMDGRGHLGDGQQTALLPHLHGDGACTDRVEDLAGEGFRDHATRRGIENKRRRVGGGETVVQPVQAEVGDRRNIDQHFRDHHEQNRENEELAREP